MQKTKKYKVLKGEKLAWIALAIMILIIPIASVYTKAVLSQTNIEVEKVRTTIEKQESINESLGMKISELASLDKIQEVATNSGLEYNNNNIKVVSNNE